MVPADTRIPCSSCGRRDVALQDCSKCHSKVCSSCWILHREYDHRDKSKSKSSEKEEGEDSSRT